MKPHKYKAKEADIHGNKTSHVITDIARDKNI
jgi:hypothetical protein